MIASFPDKKTYIYFSIVQFSNRYKNKFLIYRMQTKFESQLTHKWVPQPWYLEFQSSCDSKNIQAIVPKMIMLTFWFVIVQTRKTSAIKRNWWTPEIPRIITALSFRGGGQYALCAGLRIHKPSQHRRLATGCSETCMIFQTCPTLPQDKWNKCNYVCIYMQQPQQETSIQGTQHYQKSKQIEHCRIIKNTHLEHHARIFRRKKKC